MNDNNPDEKIYSLLAQIAYLLGQLVAVLIREGNESAQTFLQPDLPIGDWPSTQAFRYDDLLTPRQIADCFGVSEKTLANHRSRGGGWPYVLVGRRVRYRYGEVLKVIEATRRSSTSEVALPHR